MSFWDETSLQTWILIIEAFAIIATASATVKYAKLTHSLLKEQKKTIQKPRFQKIVDTILIPLLKQIKREIEELENKNFRWGRDHHIHTKIKSSTFILYNEFIYDDFKNEILSIDSKIEQHDEIIEDLEEKINKFEDTILSLPDFKEGVPREFEVFSGGEKISKDLYYILGLIVNSRSKFTISRNLDMGAKFWNAKRDELLSFWKREEVKDCVREIENLRKELIDLSKNIRDNLEIALNRYREEYGVLT